MDLCLKNELGATRALLLDPTSARTGMLTGIFVLDDLINASVVRDGLVVSAEAITHLSDTAVREIKGAPDRARSTATRRGFGRSARSNEGGSSKERHGSESDG